MKTKINKEGQLVISPKNQTDSYALANWLRNNSKGKSFKKGSIRLRLSAHILDELKMI